MYMYMPGFVLSCLGGLIMVQCQPCTLYIVYMLKLADCLECCHSPCFKFALNCYMYNVHVHVPLEGGGGGGAR